jgi:hypothetical protein
MPVTAIRLGLLATGLAVPTNRGHPTKSWHVRAQVMRQSIKSLRALRWFLAAAAALVLGFVIQSPPPGATAVAAAGEQAAVASPGELIYVPIYSSIFFDDGKRTLELAATLSIHNIDPDRPITVTRADYYNTDGKLIKKYLEKPSTLKPLQTANIVVEKSNVAGGTGANFLVEWQASQEVNSPLVEAVMVNASSNLGIAFTSSGKVIKGRGADVDSRSNQNKK